MEFSVQRIDTTPIRPAPKQKRGEGEQDSEFERELEEASGETHAEAPPEPTHHEDTPVAPRLEGEAGGTLDLTA